MLFISVCEAPIFIKSGKKTNADNADLDSHYKSQLDLYSEAFEKISGEAVKDAKIYHIDILTK